MDKQFLRRNFSNVFHARPCKSMIIIEDFFNISYVNLLTNSAHQRKHPQEWAGCTLFKNAHRIYCKNPRKTTPDNSPTIWITKLTNCGPTCWANCECRRISIAQQNQQFVAPGCDKRPLFGPLCWSFVGHRRTKSGPFLVEFFSQGKHTHRYICHITCNVHCKWHRKVSANNCGFHLPDGKTDLPSAAESHRFISASSYLVVSYWP